MAQELGEETKFTVSIKTLIAVAVAIATFVGGYYKLHSEIEAAKELPKPGKGVYIVDPGDASAKETWPPGRNEYKMKDMMARQTILQIQKELDQLKHKVEELEQRNRRNR